ncbi:heme o synthase [Sedimenticola thiotaurini]|uniref:Protoheme IX farnesyltransferase n=1 Tax=Sedimenticola thiotaurini TaxID=1543721 RepID=A0A0F7JV89_9GAMM|nr:heme o synthase [Sedimenticola thiotaurini]AKH19244.1 protoheme IX farnesyltransferase [Sedimenticola thiotaurini]
MIKQLINLFKLRIGFIMMLTALVAMAATPGRTVSLTETLVLAITVLVAAASAGAFNQYYEADLDRLMPRTSNRPFVTGYFTKGPFWLWVINGLLLVSVAIAAVVLNGMAALYIFLGAFFYAVVYTVWLKRRTWMNIVIGGASGSFAVLAGAAAVDPVLTPVPIQLALVLFFWTPSHFWSLAIAQNRDYMSAGVPMLPAVAGNGYAARVVLGNTLILVAISIMPYFYGMGWIYLLGAVSGGGYFIYRNLKMIQDAGRKPAMASFFASLIQLSLLLAGTLIDRLLLA